MSNIAYTDTYVAQQTVFFDFDIIELTFNKNGVYHVIPVVSDPVDVVNEINAPEAELQVWKIILGLVALCVLLYFLVPVLPQILSTVLDFISKIISTINEWLKKAKNKK